MESIKSEIIPATKLPTEIKIPYPLDYNIPLDENNLQPERKRNLTPNRKLERIESSSSDEETNINAKIIKDILKSQENITSNGEAKLEAIKTMKLPKNMRIPNLWNIKIEKCDNSQSSDEDKGSSEIDANEWEFL